LRPSTAAPGLFARPLELASGIRCRNWDEVLAVATQRWSVLRDALVSGELERRLASAGQSAWAPDPRQTGSADEKLDAWLARLPASRPAVAEWEVHPARIAVRATGAGGATRRSVTVQNVGHRLLSWQARLDPPAPWLAILAPSGRTQTVESDKIELEFRIPEGFTRRESTALVIESNAGVQRVELILEPAGPTTSTEIAQEPPTAQVLARPAWAEWSLMRRVGLGALTFAVLRTALAASSWFSAPSPGTSFPSLASALFTLSALGALMAGLLALRRKAMSDVGWSAAAGALAGVALAALTVALARTLEPLLGPVASHPLAAIVVWATLGALLGALWGWIIPPHSSRKA
jgi:hypothetical protein